MSDLDHMLSDDPIEEVAEEAIDAEEVETPTEEAEEPTPDVAEEPAPAPETEPQMVPLAALQETRRELQALKQIVTQPKQEAPKEPDYIDPEAAQYFQKQMQNMQSNMIAERSEMMARMAHGSEAVDKALEAAQAKGVLEQFKGVPDPWGQLTKWHKQDQIIAEVGDDPDAYRAKVRAEVEAEFQAKQVAQSVKAVPNAPSLASEPNLGSRSTPAWGGPISLDDMLNGTASQ